ncbi:BSD domain-containing protein 1 [Strongylocentrotus purpuratus]|uniref:BSD domain-containing protein n=1 Tax=Strongylocentrotus purpuratus TaxID=7668 RepID=A0A7M7NSQ2_STRPU|nr:BSD domain-containing protein 1 [Strongylocentrotus purpuratus]
MITKQEQKMAESNAKKEEGEGEAGGNWWGMGGLLKTVQEKSGSAWVQMRRDLGEFGTTIQRDTAQAAASTATLIRDQLKVQEGEDEENEDVTTTARMKVGFSKLLTGLSQSLTPTEGSASPRDDDVPMGRKDPHIFDKARARLHAMQTDPTTYCSDPDGVPEFKEWMESFNVENFKGEISELLVVNTDVRALYTKLVPAAVSHVEFWGRYFYRVQQLREDENRRRALKERADMTSSQKFEEEDLGWGDEDDTWDTVPDALKNQSGVEKFVVLPEDTDKESSGASSTEHQTESRTDQPTESNTDQQTESPMSRIAETDSSERQPSHLSSSPVDKRKSKECEDDKPTDPVPECDSVTKVDQDPSRPEPEPASQTSVLESSPSPVVEKESEPAAPIQTHQVSSTPDESIPEAPSTAADLQRTVGVEEEGSKVKVDELRLEGLTIQTEGKQDDSKAETAKAMEQTSPVASEASNRESSLSDDWEKDFDDIEVTEEDLKNASVKLSLGAVGDDDLDEDWESWE